MQTTEKNQLELTKYQEANLSFWSRTQMIEFLMSEGQRGPRSALRRRPVEWLMRECVIEGALQCNECGDETTEDNPLMDTGRCQECEAKAEESEHDEALCDCPCHGADR